MRNLANSLSSVQLPLKETHNLIKSMGQTFTNTVKWSIASNAINTLTGSVQKAWSFTKQLDTSLNDIMIVTGKSADEMERFAKKANDAAKNLGATTNQYAQAALIYYQQGLAEEDVMSRSNVTVKAANVTGQSAQAVSEQLTAIWNGYKVSAAEAEMYIDKVSAVAATTAADLEELSTGMSKVASAANAMGVDIDQLNAQLATIVSVTRQDSAVVGTALKTIYSRMGDLMVDGEDEFGTKLGEVSSSLKTMGIDVLDAQGNLRDMGIVIEEVAAKWDTWTDAQQQAAAVAIAGKRQYNNLIALFENWDMYESAKSTSETSVGTLQKQQETYLDSLDARFDKLQASAEELYLSLFDSDSFKTLLDSLTTVVQLVGNFTESIGGAGSVLSMLIPLVLRLTSGEIANGLSTFIANQKTATTTAASLKSALTNVNQLLGNNNFDEATLSIERLRKQMLELRLAGLMTNEQFNDLDATFNAMAETANDMSIVGKDVTSQKQDYDKLAAIYGTGKETTLHEVDIAGALNAQAQAAQSGRVLTSEEQNNQTLYLQNLNNLKQAYEDSVAPINKMEKAVKAYNEAQAAGDDKKKAKALEEIKAHYEGVTAAVEQLKATDVLEKGQKSSITKRTNNMKDSIAELESEDAKARLHAVQKLEAQMKSVSNTTDMAGKSIKAMFKGLEKAPEANQKVAILKQTFDKLGHSAAEFLNKLNLERKIESFIKLSSVIASTASAIQIFTSIGKIWDNESLSTSEKIVQTITNMGTGLSMLIPLVTALSGAFQKKKVKELEAAGATSLHALANKALNEAKEDVVEETKTSITEQQKEQQELNETALAAGGATAAYLALAKAKKAANNSDSDGVGDLAADAAKDVATDAVKDIAAKGAKTAATTAGAAAATGGGTAAAAGGTALAAAGPYALIAVAVIALIAAALYSYHKGVLDAEKAAEKAQKRAKEMAEEYTKAKEEAQALKESLDSYKETQQALDELVVGTEEWAAALEEANKQVFELVSTYPELAQYMSNENGRLVLSEAGAEEAQKRANERVNTTYRAKLAADIEANEAGVNVFKEKLRRDAGYSVYDAATDTTTTKRATDKELAAAVKVLQEHPELMAGSQQDLVAELRRNDALKSADEELLWALASNKDALINLTSATDGAAQKNLLLRQEIARSQLSQNALYQALQEQVAQAKKQNALIKREDYKDTKEYYNAKIEQQNIEEQATQQMQMLNDYYASDAVLDQQKVEAQRLLINGAISGDITNDNVTKIDEDTRKELAKQYWSQKLGIPASEITLKHTGGNSYTLQYVGADGKKVKQSGLDYADAINNLIDEKAASMTPSEDEAKLILDKFNNIFDSATLANAFAGFMGDAVGDFSKLTQKEIEKLKETSLTQEMADALGVTLDQLKEGFNKALDAWDETEELITGRLRGAELFEGAWKELSQQVRNDFSLLYDEIITARGIEGAKALDEVTDILAEQGEDAIRIFAYELNATDWTDTTSIQNLRQAMVDLGIASSTTSPAIDSLITELGWMKGFFESINPQSLTTAHNTLQEILSKLKNIGDTIDAEQYKKLEPALQEYFFLMEDGTYALTVAAEEFSQIANDIKNDTLDSTIKAYETELTREVSDSEIKLLKNAIENAQKNIDYASSYQGYSTFQAELKTKYKNSKTGVNKEWFEEGWDLLTQSDQQLVEALNNRQNLDSSELAQLSNVYARMQKQLRTRQAEKELKEAEDALIIAQADGLTAEDRAKKESELQALYSHKIKTATNITDLQNIFENFNFDAFGENADKVEEALQEEYNTYKKILEEAAANFEIEYDKYELYQKQYDILERLRKNLQIDRAADKDKIVLLTQEIALLKQQKDIQTAIATEKKADAESLLTEINATTYGEDVNILKAAGVAFETDENGYIQNKDGVLDAVETYVREHYDSDKATSILGAFTTDLDTYTTLIDKALGAEDAVIEAGLTIQDNYAKIIQQTIDGKKKVKDLKLEYQDFKRSLLEDNDYAGIANTYLREAEAIEEEALTFSARRARLDADWAAQRITDAEYQAQLEALNQDAQEAVLTLKEAEANVEDQLVSAIEARADAYDDYIEKIKTANDLYEKQIDLTALLYGEQSEEFFNASVGYYQQISNSYTDILIQSMNAANDAWDTFDKLRTPVEKGGLGLSEEDEAYQAARETAVSAIQEYYDNLGEAVEAAQKAYFAIVDKQLNAFEYGMTGGLGLERLNERWEWQQRMADKYLDTTNRIYETSALAYEFDKAARSTSSLNTQKAINEAKEEELKILREKDKLTQYDLNRAKLRLEITQAEIALQEAQANKTQMRLTRGADGTYSYQYVADMNEVEDKKQELADLNNELYNLDKDKYRENLEEVYDIYAEYIEKIRKFGEDGIFSEDELENLAQFRDYLKDLAGENSDVWTHLEGLMNRDGIYGKLVEGLTNDTFDTLEGELTSALTVAGQTYTERMTELKNKLAEANGENGAGGLLEKFSEVNEATDTFIEKMDTAINGPEGLLKSLGDINGKYNALAKSLKDMIDKLQTEIPNLINTADPNQKNTPVTSRLGYIEGNSYNFKGDRSGLWEAYGLTETGGKGAYQAITKKDITAGKYGSTAKLLKIVKNEDGEMDLGLVQFDNGVMMWVDLSRHQLGDDIKGFDTGGYTGDWGSTDGRLAMLHRKELVLNEEDTKNFLAGINILRSLDTAMFQTMSSMFKTLDFNTAVHEVINDEAIEQIVYVTAEFPNATDKNEILEAFKEISNLAGQRATKNSRQ